MNDKLKAWEGRMSVKLAGRSGRGRGVGTKEALVVMSIGKEGITNKQKARDVLRVSFHPHILDLTGWKVGDIIDMEIQGESATIFRGEKGVQLCSTGNSSKRLLIRYSFPLGDLNGLPYGICREVEAKPSRIAFLLPKVIEI